MTTWRHDDIHMSLGSPVDHGMINVGHLDCYRRPPSFSLTRRSPLAKRWALYGPTIGSTRDHSMARLLSGSGRGGEVSFWMARGLSAWRPSLSDVAGWPSRPLAALGLVSEVTDLGSVTGDPSSCHRTGNFRRRVTETACISAQSWCRSPSTSIGLERANLGTPAAEFREVRGWWSGASVKETRCNYVDHRFHLPSL